MYCMISLLNVHNIVTVDRHTVTMIQVDFPTDTSANADNSNRQFVAVVTEVPCSKDVIVYGVSMWLLLSMTCNNGRGCIIDYIVCQCELLFHVQDTTVFIFCLSRLLIVNTPREAQE